MGQKTNRIVLQLGNKLNWNNVWCENIITSNALVINDIETSNRFQIIIRHLMLSSSAISTKRFNSKLLMYSKLISHRKLVENVNTSYSENVQSVQKASIESISPLMNNVIVRVSNYGEQEKNKYLYFLQAFKVFSVKQKLNYLPFAFSSMLCHYISEQLKGSKKPNDLNFQKNLLNSLVRLSGIFISKTNAVNILGIKIQCSGRWSKTRSGRKQKIVMVLGKTASESNKSLASSSFSAVSTRFGVTGIKVSIRYKATVL